MDVQLMEIGMRIRKIAMYISRCCYRSVCRHPFLMGFFCFLICLHRSFPLIFSLLVSVSPVLVCTAVLLGTLLSFGQPNIPEIEKEEKTTAYEAVLIRTGVSTDAAAVVEKSEGCFVESFSNEVDLLASELGGVPGEVVSEVTVPLIEERERSREVELNDEKTKRDDDDGMCSDDGGESSREIELNVGEHWESKVVEKMEWDEERQSDGEVVENQYSPIPVVDDGRSSSDDDKTEGADSFGSEKVNVDTLDSPPRSPWTQVASREEEVARKGDNDDEDEEGEDADSGSDRAESSSPDASITDIIPMLDELHPLLNQVIPRLGHFSLDGSDVASERSLKSSCHELENEAENHEDDDDDDDNEDEEDGHGEREEGIKSAITWTEEDQKNLMDLGSSEIERNLWLESLILRRRARRNMNMLPERDLIDLESLDFPFSVAPISTRRHNPFDHPNDFQDNSGLPPIPGSAPSVLLPRRNPFDIPYDSSEEKPDLSGGGFREEFTVRRHENFNVRPSVFAQDGNDVKMRLYFTPDQTISEESSYSLFQRQLSEVSESKVISVMETESISSVENMNDGKYSEDDNLGKVEDIQQVKASSEKNSSSGNLEQIPGVHKKRVLTSIVESVSEHVNESSEEPERPSELGLAEKAEFDDDELKFQAELTQAVEAYANEYDPNSDDIGQRYRSSSSSSSLSEESERVFTEMESEEFPVLEGRNNRVADEVGITAQTSVERNELSIINASVVNVDVAHREPVYDSSPQEVIGMNVFSSSSSSDVLLPMSDPGSTPILVKRTVSFIEREPEVTSSEIESSILSEPSDKASTKENTGEESNSGEIPTASPSTDPVHSFDGFSQDHNRQDQPQEETKHFEKVVEPHDINACATCEAVENLISFPDEENASTIHCQAIKEPFSEHPHEMQESSVSLNFSKDDLTMQEFSLAEIQELDCNISSNTEAPLIHDFSSFGSSSFEMAKPLSDLQTIVEEVDEIKEIDERLLSELDNVGDFSIGQWGYGSSEFETNEESAGGSFDSSQHLEMNKTGAVEVNSVEEAFHLEIPSRDVHVDLLEMDSNESNVQDSPYQEEPVILLEENEAVHFHSMEEDSTRAIPEVEVQSMEDADPVENEITSGDAGVSHQLSQVDSIMPELEASTIEDIDVVFKKIGQEIDKPVKQPPADDAFDEHPDLVDPLVQTVESGDKIKCNPETIPLEGDNEKQHKRESDDGLEEGEESDKEGPSVEVSSVKEVSDFSSGKPHSEVEEQVRLSEVEAPKEFGEVESPKGLGEVEAPKEFGEVEAPKDLGEVEAPKEFGEVEAPKNLDEVEPPKDLDEVEAPKDMGEVEAPKEFGGEVEAPKEIGEVEAPKEFGEVEASKDLGEVEAPKEFGEVEAPKDLSEVGEPKDLDSSKGVEEEGKIYKSSSSSSNDTEKI